jgi:hypothetical protein
MKSKANDRIKNYQIIGKREERLMMMMSSRTVYFFLMLMKVNLFESADFLIVYDFRGEKV